jgi:hypothetical protein
MLREDHFRRDPILQQPPDGHYVRMVTLDADWC